MQGCLSCCRSLMWSEDIVHDEVPFLEDGRGLGSLQSTNLQSDDQESKENNVIKRCTYNVETNLVAVSRHSAGSSLARGTNSQLKSQDSNVDPNHSTLFIALECSAISGWDLQWLLLLLLLVWLLLLLLRFHLPLLSLLLLIFLLLLTINYYYYYSVVNTIVVAFAIAVVLLFLLLLTWIWLWLVLVLLLYCCHCFLNLSNTIISLSILLLFAIAITTSLTVTIVIMMFIMFTTLMILSLLPNRPSLTVVKGCTRLHNRHGGVRDAGCKLLDTRQEGLAMDSRGLRLSTRAGISRQIHSGNNLMLDFFLEADMPSS